MSIPKRGFAKARTARAAGGRPETAAGRSGAPPGSPRRGHYFDVQPAVESKPRSVRLQVADLDLRLEADRGVFGSKGVDLGTMVLLREAPRPPETGELLDLGCGYGPIAIALGKWAPKARVWAVDVNRRALELTAANARTAGADNVVALAPDEVPDDIRFDAIYANPPVRVGKAPLHELLTHWLARLAPSASAYFVVQRNLGADSLAGWLSAEAGYDVVRLKSKKGYRVLRVGAPP